MKPANKLELVPFPQQQRSEVNAIIECLGDKVILQFPEALANDNENGIHQLRIAIRKFRTALKDLRPLINRKTTRPINKRLKKMASYAGRVRDHDVAMKFLRALRNQTEDVKVIAGLDLMIGERQHRRSRARVLFEKHVDQAAIEKITETIRATSSKVHDAKEHFSEIRQKVITQRRAEFLDLIPAIYRPYDEEGQHLLRIAAKALRYSVETFEDPAAMADAPLLSNNIAEMQDHLGKVHDCDVWIATLSEGLRTAYRKGLSQRSDFVAAEWLLGKLINRRAKNYQEALELCAEWRTGGFLDKLCS